MDVFKEQFEVQGAVKDVVVIVMSLYDELREHGISHGMALQASVDLTIGLIGNATGK